MVQLSVSAPDGHDQPRRLAEVEHQHQQATHQRPQAQPREDEDVVPLPDAIAPALVLDVVEGAAGGDQFALVRPDGP